MSPVGIMGNRDQGNEQKCSGRFEGAAGSLETVDRETRGDA